MLFFRERSILMCVISPAWPSGLLSWLTLLRTSPFV